MQYKAEDAGDRHSPGHTDRDAGCTDSRTQFCTRPQLCADTRADACSHHTAHALPYPGADALSDDRAYALPHLCADDAAVESAAHHQESGR